MRVLLLAGIFIFVFSFSAFAGEKIAYTKMHEGFWQVWEKDTAGKDRLLTQTPMDKSSPDWSSDGKKLAYTTSEGELWLLDMKNGENSKVPLNIPVSEPKWSKDGKRILFASAHNVFHDDLDIWLADATGKNLIKVTKRPWAQISPAWLPGEEEVLFVDSPEIMGDEICKINIKSGEITRFTQNKFNDIQPAYLSVKDKIIYAANKSGNYDIWMSDKTGKNFKNLIKNSSCDIMPKTSADGRRVYFLSDRTGYFQIFSLELKTKRIKQITNDSSDKKDFAVYAQ